MKAFDIRIETIYFHFMKKVVKANICMGEAQSLSYEHDREVTQHMIILFCFLKVINLHCQQTGYMDKTQESFLAAFLKSRASKGSLLRCLGS